jgi:hypothetical protein
VSKWKVKSCLNCNKREHGCIVVQRRSEKFHIQYRNEASVEPCSKWELNQAPCDNCMKANHCDSRILNDIAPHRILGCYSQVEVMLDV